jgi:hypothetical protein
MTHLHPWRINPEAEAWPELDIHDEVKIVDANDNFVCWAYEEEAAQIVAMSEAMGLLREWEHFYEWSRRPPAESVLARTRTLLARIDGDKT